jgi:hypothetical protein
MKHLLIAVVGLAAVMTIGGMAQAALTVFDQGFEVNTAGMIVDPSYGESITRVASGGGALGVSSASGSYHAEIALNGGYGNGVFTRNGGYSSVWPGSITQSIKVYIDPAAGQVSDGWFWDPGVNNGYGTWGRGGGFGVQKTSTGAWSLGAEDDYGGFDYVGHSGWTTHTNTTPLQITTAGWYQLATEWVENADHTRVNQINTVLDNAGSSLWTDTLANCMSLTPGDADFVGGIRYSWLGSQGPSYEGEISPLTGLPIVANTMSVLAIDDVQASVLPEPATMALLALGGVAAMARRRRKGM